MEKNLVLEEKQRWYSWDDHHVLDLLKDTFSRKTPYLLGTTPAMKRLIQNFRFRRSGSIEHMLPQTRMGDTAGAIPPDDSFGTLALVSSSRNSRFGHLPPAGKMDVILQSGYVESLKMAHFLLGDHDPQAAGRIMHEILVESVRPK